MSAPAEKRRLVLVAAVALVDADGRVLIAQRPQGKPLAGLWEFPGGKVESGETPEETLLRELSEEIGIETKAECLAPLTFASHAYEDFHLLMPLYVCRRFQGTPMPLGYLTPLALTNEVVCTAKRPPYTSTFTNGILCTQLILNILTDGGTREPRSGELEERLSTKDDTLRRYLTGDVLGLVRDFFEGQKGGRFHAALYELAASLPGLAPNGFQLYDGHNNQPDRAEREAAVRSFIQPVLDLLQAEAGAPHRHRPPRSSTEPGWSAS